MTETWDSYVLHSGDKYATFWQAYLADAPRDLLYIGGRGFDPRAWTCLIPLARAGTGQRTIWELLIGTGKRYEGKMERNAERLANAIENSTWKREAIDLSAAISGIHGSSTAVIADLLKQRSDWSAYSDIVIDLTAMPRVIGLALVHVLLSYHDAHKTLANIHVVVMENPDVDRRIKAMGYSQSVYHVHGFEAAFESERCKRLPTAWIPILGEHEAGQIEAVRRFLQESEANQIERLPAVPSPSRNPRRGDDLLAEYRGLLFPADGNIEAHQIVYVAETNPFEAYRQILRAMRSFEKVTSEHLGGARVAISLHSSKLLSLAALMAAYDAKKGKVVQAVTLLHMEPSHYDIEDGCPEDGTLVTAWLKGAAYA